MTSAMPVQCSNQLSYEVTQWRAGQFVGLMFSRERNLMALPFLPAIEIPTTFEQLRLRANSDSLKALVAYIDSTWVYSSTFPPKDWSVYGQAIRTNNDLEGRHNALNRRAGGKGPHSILLADSTIAQRSHADCCSSSVGVR